MASRTRWLRRLLRLRFHIIHKLGWVNVSSDALSCNPRESCARPRAWFSGLRRPGILGNPLLYPTGLTKAKELGQQGR